MIRRMRKIFLTSLAMLSIASFVFAIPVNALTYLNPDDYLYEITSDGTNNIARYDFSSLYCYIHTWDDSSNTHADARWEVQYDVPREAWSVLMDVFPLGGYQEATALDWRSVALDVSDILPGSPLPITCGFTYDFECADLLGVDAVLHYSLGVYYFDSDGSYMGTVGGEPGTYDLYADVETGFSERIKIAGTFPANAHYVVPFLTLRTVFADNDHDCYIYVRSDSLTMDVTIDTVIENSNMMQSINNKLDAVGDKIDGTNDRLDQIISGGEAGDSLGAAGDQLEDASGAVSDKADTVTDDIGSVGDFESGVMDDINDTFGQIDISSGVGKFTTSLAFVSNYVQLIFKGVENWEVAITLPLFLGLFFGICQHVGGVANMRARQAREVRNEELHQARLEKIQKGGSK